MRTINKIYNKTLEVKQSKFIAYLAPFHEFEKLLKQLKEQHPKARHFVTASRYINEFDQIVESSSDDGEPKGTSGKPTLAVLQGHELINIAIITIRYFGGTKLGTGGLVRAYSDATNDVIAIAELHEYEKKESYTIKFSYSDMGRVEYELEKLHITIESKEFANSVCFTLECKKEDYQALIKVLDRVLL